MDTAEQTDKNGSVSHIDKKDDKKVDYYTLGYRHGKLHYELLNVYQRRKAIKVQAFYCYDLNENITSETITNIVAKYEFDRLESFVDSISLMSQHEFSFDDKCKLISGWVAGVSNEFKEQQNNRKKLTHKPRMSIQECTISMVLDAVCPL